jgi:hypothetical protein
MRCKDAPNQVRLSQQGNQPRVALVVPKGDSTKARILVEDSTKVNSFMPIETYLRGIPNQYDREVIKAQLTREAYQK